MKKVKSETAPAYVAPNAANLAPEEEDRILEQAEQILRARIPQGEELTSSRLARLYVKTRIATKEREVFTCIFLDNRHRIIEVEELFYGTLDGSMVHPREVAKRALQLNAGAVIFAHNHPSGHCEPSQADIGITRRLKAALELLDIRTLDHFVVTCEEVTSLAERGAL